MSNWTEKTIGDLGKVVTGKTPSKKESQYYENGYYPFVSPKDISKNQYYVGETETKITEKAMEKHKNQVIPRNAILFTSLSFSFGKMAIAKESCMTNQQINSIIVNEEHDYLFVYYLLQVYRPIVFSYNSGIDTPLVPKSVFESIKVNCPNLSEQKKIAALLSTFDELIENNKRQINVLEKLAVDTYKEWFVRFRFPGYQDAEFEKGIPKNWETKKFREIVSYYIGGGWGEDSESPIFSDKSYVIRGTDIPKLGGGNYSHKVLRYHKPSNLKSRKLEENDFVFEVSGGSKDQLLGRNLMISRGLLNLFENTVMCASFCKQIRFNSDLISPFFMKYFLKLYYECNLVGIYQVQSTGISNYQFESFLNFQTITSPNKQLQIAFEKLVKPIIEQQDKLAFENLNLEKTKNMLLPRLISGKLSVEDVDVILPPNMQE